MGIWKKVALPARFSSVFVKHILGVQTTLGDFADLNHSRNRTQLQFVLDNALWDDTSKQFTFKVDDVQDIKDILCLSGVFTVETDFGEVVELKHGGSNIKVTEENKFEFV